MNEHFCFLEKDKKTFSYVMRFVDFIENNKTKNIISLGNKIQREEIEEHLKRNNIKENAVAEEIKWVEKNGKGFRIYLNTIKIAALIFYSRDRDCGINCTYKKHTFKNFCKIVDDINSIKLQIIESLF
jgi:hypothetical protein